MIEGEFALPPEARRELIVHLNDLAVKVDSKEKVRVYCE